MIRVLRGNLEELSVDGVVRPVGSDGESVSAVGRRLEAAAGEDMAARLQRMGDVPVGGAILTPGGDLPARFVLHVVVRSPEEPITRHTVQRALLNALGRARDWDLGSLALPPMGLGAGNLESESAAEMIVRLLGEHADTGDAPGDIVIVVESEYEEEVFTQALARAGDRGAPA